MQTFLNLTRFETIPPFEDFLLDSEFDAFDPIEASDYLPIQSPELEVVE